MRLKRRSRCFSRSIEKLQEAARLFVWHYHRRRRVINATPTYRHSLPLLFYPLPRVAEFVSLLRDNAQQRIPYIDIPSHALSHPSAPTACGEQGNEGRVVVDRAEHMAHLQIAIAFGESSVCDPYRVFGNRTDQIWF